MVSASACAHVARMPALSPPPTSPRARAVMRGNRSTDTLPEIALRRELHRRGLRFRKHVQVVPGLRCRPDVVFARARVAVECRGCFWHSCPADVVLPKSNLDYWLPKLQRTVERDKRNEARLAEAGWNLVVVWEHENPISAADRIEQIVRRATNHSPC
jgi:DNA mismatch endonuclease (patch repair protein)